MVKNILSCFILFAVFGVTTGQANKPEAPRTQRDDTLSASRCIVDDKAIEDIKTQKALIQKREDELKTKEEEMKAREVALGEEIKKLDDLRKQVTQTRVSYNEKQQVQLAKLVETLEKMSPKASAKVMAEVDESLAVEAMSAMSTEKLAKVMANLDPVKSSRLSELLTIGKATERVPAAQTQKEKRK